MCTGGSDGHGMVYDTPLWDNIRESGLLDPTVHFHEYWTLHIEDNYDFQCPVCGAREHTLFIHYVAVDHVKNTPFKCHVNQMIFVTYS